LKKSTENILLSTLFTNYRSNLVPKTTFNVEHLYYSKKNRYRYGEKSYRHKTNIGIGTTITTIRAGENLEMKKGRG